MDKTLEDSDIESVMSEIMSTLENKCKAELR
jgi:phenylalanyl-tRNA synthetase beta subunit